MGKSCMCLLTGGVCSFTHISWFCPTNVQHSYVENIRYSHVRNLTVIIVCCSFFKSYPPISKAQRNKISFTCCWKRRNTWASGGGDSRDRASLQKMLAPGPYLPHLWQREHPRLGFGWHFQHTDRFKWEKVPLEISQSPLQLWTNCLGLFAARKGIYFLHLLKKHMAY